MIKQNSISKEAEYELDIKIFAAFERISVVLRTQAWKAGKELSLNPVQMQLLIFLLNHKDFDNTITSLSSEFAVSAASLSDTVKSLHIRELIDKIFPSAGSRSFKIQLTRQGQIIAQKISFYGKEIFSGLELLGKNEKCIVLESLSKIIFKLYENGALKEQRMCWTCRFYEKNEVGNFCSILQQNITNEHFQIDCSDHNYRS